MTAPTAARLGLLGCHVCELVSRPSPGAPRTICPRCGARIHSRKPSGTVKVTRK